MKNLLINPPEYSYESRYFGEYPIGLMKLSTYLKSIGESAEMFDFLPYKGFGGWDGKTLNLSESFDMGRDPCVSEASEYRAYKGQPFGLFPTSFSRPTGEHISRFGFLRDRYYQGIDKGFFIEYLKNNKPDRIWVSSGMTYGYRGTVEVIDICKSIYPDVEVRLGGVYPTLCHEHAKSNTKADIVYSGECDEFKDCELDYDILPNKPQYIIVQLCKGCPNKCKFCAVSYMDGLKVRYVDIDKSIESIKLLNEKYGLRHIRLWGSNLLLPKKGKLFEEWIDKLIALDKKFIISCPEGFAPELLTESICRKIKEAGFYNIVIPLEEANNDSLVNRLGKVYDVAQWERAVEFAKKAGIPSSSIQVPVIVGTPGQKEDDIIKFLDIIVRLGVKPGMAKYVPVPKSQWYEESEYFRGLDLEYCNGILYPAITNIKDYQSMSKVFGALMHSLVSNYEKPIENFLKEKGESVGDRVNCGAEAETSSNSKDIIRKMAVLIVDIAEQNSTIIDLLKKLTESRESDKT